MDASEQQIELLLKLQEADKVRLQSQHALETLPQREQILEVRKKRVEVQAKLEKVQAMYDGCTAELERLNEEDERLVLKQAETQEKISEASGDYRAVTTLTRDLEGMAKRRETLEFEMGKTDVKMGEVGTVLDQAKAAMVALTERERDLTLQYKENHASLSAVVAKGKEAREAIAAHLDKDLLEAYEDSARKCAGIALSTLDGNRCGTCRNTIEDVRLLQIKHEAPISHCPICRRLLIVPS